MNVVLWILQGLLAVAFAFAGVTKLTQPIAKIEKSMPWVTRFRPPVVRFIGGMELLGALGLILPAATGIAPILTPLAATGLALIMVLAATHHLRNNEAGAIPINAVLFVIAAVIAWGRFGPYSF
jgi:uncharacterized membrane protein